MNGLLLWYPVRQNIHRPVWLVWVIRGQMHLEIVHAVHTLVHHKLHGKGRAFARFKRHRTDGWSGWSAPLYDFNVGLLAEAYRLVAYIREFKRHLNGLA